MLSIIKRCGALLIFVILVAHLANGHAMTKEMFERYGVKFGADYKVEMPKRVEITKPEGNETYVMIKFPSVEQVFAAYAKANKEDSYYFVFEDMKWYLTIEEQRPLPGYNQKDCELQAENTHLKERLHEMEAEFQAETERLEKKVEEKTLEFFKLGKSYSDNEEKMRELNKKIKELEEIISSQKQKISELSKYQCSVQEEQGQEIDKRNRRIANLEKEVAEANQVVAEWISKNGFASGAESDFTAPYCPERQHAMSSKKKKRKAVKLMPSKPESLASQITTWLCSPKRLKGVN